MVEDLEIQLKTERSRLRTLITDQMQAERQKEEVVLQLRRTESVSLLPSKIQYMNGMLNFLIRT